MSDEYKYKHVPKHLQDALKNSRLNKSNTNISNADSKNIGDRKYSDEYIEEHIHLSTCTFGEFIRINLKSPKSLNCFEFDALAEHLEKEAKNFIRNIRKD